MPQIKEVILGTTYTQLTPNNDLLTTSDSQWSARKAQVGHVPIITNLVLWLPIICFASHS